jgi:hypothetical protein
MQDGQNDLRQARQQELETLAVKLRLQETFIQPFQQTPSDNNTPLTGSRIGTHELFSLFTADIIRQRVVFTR